MIGLCIGVNGLVCRAQHSPMHVFTNNARNTYCYQSWFLRIVEPYVSFMGDVNATRSIHMFNTKEGS